jgi:hypothetical protein
VLGARSEDIVTSLEPEETPMIRFPFLLFAFSLLMLCACGDGDSSTSPSATSDVAQVAPDAPDASQSADTSSDASVSGDSEEGTADTAPAHGPLAEGELAVVEPGGETICSRGTDFRFFAVGGNTDKIVLDFAGGGACWNDITCGVADAIFSPEAPSKEEIEGMVASGYSPGFYDLDNPDNPFLGWTLVHIPYCTGDVHWGNNVVDYNDDLTIHHKGHVNFQAVMQWVKERYPDPSHIMVTGCSAGAYGAVGSSPHVQKTWPDTKLTVLADSGAGIITQNFFQDSFPNWNATEMVPWWLPELEGKSVDDLDIVSLYSAIVNGIPDMRVAQYNTAFDRDQIFYYDVMGGEAEDWHPKLVETLAEITARAPAFRHYTAPGPIHCLHPYDFFYEREVNGVAYSAWLYELAHGADAPDTVACAGESCLDDPICAACLDGTSGDPGCGWCDGWDPAP